MEILWTCCEMFLAALRRTYNSKKITITKVQEYKGTSWTFVLHDTLLIVMSGNLVSLELIRYGTIENSRSMVDKFVPVHIYGSDNHY